MSLKVLIYLILTCTLIYEIRSAPNNRPPVPESNDELQKVINCKATDQFPHLSDFSFNPHEVLLEDTICLCFRMFNESGLISMFNISTPILTRFIQQAQKKYQKVPYHNWHHGFSVLQFSFAILKTCQLFEKNHLSSLEGLALLTAAMCHDIDHPGTNNQYQIEVNNSLAQKYNNQGSILERHHIEMTLNILENVDTNFINHFEESKQAKFKKLIRQIILATDLKVHLKLLPEMEKMASTGFNEQSEEHREILLSIIISCADLSDQGRDWATSRKSFHHILTEFFTQGDQEKKIGFKPSKMMDREQADVPQLEIDFYTNVIIPNFQILTSLCSEIKSCLDNSQRNLIYWQKSIPYFKRQLSLGRKPLDIISDKTLDNITSLDII